MCMKCCMGFVFLYFFILRVSAQVRVEYLKEIPRFNNTLFRDYYFCCNVDGPNLQWVINGFGVGGFTVGARDLDDYAFIGTRSNFDYVGTLLSLRSNATEHRFDSVIIVSLPDDSTLNVLCFSDVGSASTSNRILPEDGTLPIDSVDSDATIVLMTRALRRVIIPGQANTSIFICGAEDQNQGWQANGNGRGFDVDTEIGTEFSIPTDDQARAKLRFVFMARVPRRLVSILFLTDPSDVIVTCLAGNQTAVLSSASSVSGTESSSISSSENIVTTSGSQTEGLIKTSPSQLPFEKVSAALPLQVNAMKIALATVFSAIWGFLWTT